MKKIGSIRNIILSIIIVFIGFFALSFGIGGRIIGEFWLLIAGLLASRIIYGKMFYLFKKMKVKDGLLVIGCLGLTIIWVIIYGIVSQLLGLSMESNPVMESPNFWTFVLFIPALLGEELLVLVPVPVILRRLEEKQKKTKWSVALLVLINSLLFGALHLNISMEFLTSSLSCWDRESTFYTGVYENKKYPSSIFNSFSV